jgi:hypothetical protein
LLVFLVLKRPLEALAQYETSLKTAPGRFNAVYGAAKAAELASQMERARKYYGALVAQCAPDATRPELAEARRFLSRPAATSTLSQ